MIFNELIKKLSSEYNTVVIDISLFFTPNGKNNLYKLLKSYYQDSYPDNYRLVLFFDVDQYTYDSQPGDLITSLQHIINDIDISHYFIVIISSNIRVKSELDVARSLYAVDRVPIAYYQADNIVCETKVVNSSISSTICNKPWNHLYVGTDGKVLPCCVADKNFPVGDTRTESFEEIVNSTAFKNIRKNMLSNKRPIECRQCYELEEAGVQSLRQIDPSNIDTANKDGSVDKFLPDSMDIRLNNTCNFKCRMCTGYYSSQIAAEEKRVYKIEVPAITLQSKNDVLSDILKVTSNVNFMYFAGGEPLLMPEHYKILEHLISINKTDIKIGYNTNLSLLKFKGIDVIEYWNKFSNVHIGASLDAMGNHAEYIRNGTVWNDIEKNYKTIRKESPHVKFNISSIVNVYNAFNLIQFQQDWISNSMINADQFNVRALTGPEYLSIQVLPSHYKHTLSIAISSHIDFLSRYNCESLVSEWHKVIEFLNSADASHLLGEFFRYTDKLDERRNEKFEDVFIEYKELRNHFNKNG